MYVAYLIKFLEEKKMASIGWSRHIKYKKIYVKKKREKKKKMTDT